MANKNNLKSRGFYALVIALVLSGMGVTVSPEMVGGLVEIGCEVVGCGV